MLVEAEAHRHISHRRHILIGGRLPLSPSTSSELSDPSPSPDCSQVSNPTYLPDIQSGS